MMQINLQLFGGRGSSSGGGGGGSANEQTQDQHRQAVARLASDDYEDGTYDVSTLRQIEYDSGYQVTFCQIGDNYSNAEYADKVNEFLSASTDGVTSAGKFGGTPEVSFHVGSKSKAVALAKKYNQISVWDWKNCDQILTGGTGERS